MLPRWQSPELMCPVAEIAGERSLAFDGVDKVSQVRPQLFAGFGRRGFPRPVNFPTAAIENQGAAFAVKRDRRAAAFDAVMAPQPMFPDDGFGGGGLLLRFFGAGRRLELVIDEQGVGGFLLIVEGVFAAARGDLLRPIDAQSPAGDIQHVDAPVAQFAGAVVPEPMPVVMKAVRLEFPLRSGAEPKIVIDAGGHFALRLETDRLPAVYAPCLGERNLAPACRSARTRSRSENGIGSAAAIRIARFAPSALRRRACVRLPRDYAKRVFRCKHLSRPGRRESSSGRANGRAWRSPPHPRGDRPSTLRKSCSRFGVRPWISATDLAASRAMPSSMSQTVTTSASGRAAKFSARVFPCPRTPITPRFTRSWGAAWAALAARPTPTMSGRHSGGIFRGGT